MTLAVEAAETWVEAKAPVRARAATAVRTMSFMDLSLLNQKFVLLLATASTHTAGIRVIGRAGRNRHSAVAGDGDRGGGGGGDLGRGKGTGENEGGDGGTNDELHLSYLCVKIFLTLQKISLDRSAEVTI
jgi:hypothetical protein